MAKSNLSLQEIMTTLQQAGATGGNSFDMGQNRMGVQQGITNTLTSQANPILEQNKANYMAQIAKIAQMDQKLAGVYGDPTSPLYIERASKRDAAVNMGDATNIKAAGTISDLYTAKKQELQDSISQTLSVYDELTKMTKAEETQAKKKKTTIAGGTGGWTTTQYKELTRAGINPADKVTAGKYIYNTDNATQNEILNRVLNGQLDTVDSKTIDKVKAEVVKTKAKETATKTAENKAAKTGAKRSLF